MVLSEAREEEEYLLQPGPLAKPLSPPPHRARRWQTAPARGHQLLWAVGRRPSGSGGRLPRESGLCSEKERWKETCRVLVENADTGGEARKTGDMKLIVTSLRPGSRSDPQTLCRLLNFLSERDSEGGLILAVAVLQGKLLW